MRPLDLGILGPPESWARFLAGNEQGAQSSPNAALRSGVGLAFLLWTLLWLQNQCISAALQFSRGRCNANPSASHLASLRCRGSSRECPALFGAARPHSSCTWRVCWGHSTMVVLLWNCLRNLIIPRAGSLLAFLLRKSLQLQLHFKSWRKAELSWLPWPLSRVLALESSFLTHFLLWGKPLSYVLGCWIVLVLDLVERFLLKLFSVRSWSATPDPFTGTSTYPKLSTHKPSDIQDLCVLWAWVFHTGNIRLVCHFFVSECDFFQNDKAGKKCSHLGKWGSSVRLFPGHLSCMYLFHEEFYNFSFLFQFGTEESLWSKKI